MYVKLILTYQEGIIKEYNGLDVNSSLLFLISPNLTI